MKRPAAIPPDDSHAAKIARLRALPQVFDATVAPPPVAEGRLRNVVVLMRHGDRTMIGSAVGSLDLSHLESKWKSLLPDEVESAELQRVKVERGSDASWMQDSPYAFALGTGPWGQLTSRGVAQCKALGRELRRRYPAASVRAFSTDFPRTRQSAAAVLIGLGVGDQVSIIIHPPKEQVLLPNFDGRCRRFAERRAEVAAPTNSSAANQDLERTLEPLVGKNALKVPALDFRPLCIYEKELGVVPGIDWVMVDRCELFHAEKEATVNADAELVRLSSGRLLHWVTTMLAEPGHALNILLAHDNMLACFLVALGVFRREWPIYCSAVLLETAEGVTSDELLVRVLVNDQVRKDWQPLAEFLESIKSNIMTAQEYEVACAAGM